MIQLRELSGVEDLVPRAVEHQHQVEQQDSEDACKGPVAGNHRRRYLSVATPSASRPPTTSAAASTAAGIGETGFAEIRGVPSASDTYGRGALASIRIFSWSTRLVTRALRYSSTVTLASRS